MSVLIQGNQVRAISLGIKVSKSTGTLAATTVPLFTIAGGLVLVTSLVGRVTTAITVANSYKLQHNPTLGTTVDLCTAADLGTTDTAAGTVVGFNNSIDDPATTGATFEKKIELGGHLLRDLVVTTGDIEMVVTGTNPDGAITWYATWVPLTDGATLVAG